MIAYAAFYLEGFIEQYFHHNISMTPVSMVIENALVVSVID